MTNHLVEQAHNRTRTNSNNPANALRDLCSVRLCFMTSNAWAVSLYALCV